MVACGIRKIVERRAFDDGLKDTENADAEIENVTASVA